MSLINSKKIRYSILDRFLEERINHIIEIADEVVIHIDVATLFRKLYSPPLAEQIQNLKPKDKFLISVELLNIAGHYRHYFWNNYNCMTTILCYYNFQKCENYIDLLPSFKEDIYYKRFEDEQYRDSSKIINDNILLSKLVMEYIPNIYFIDTQYMDTGLAMYYMLLNYDKCKNASNFIISTYVPYNQLLNVNTKELNKKMTIDVLYPEGKNSKFITEKDILNTLLKKHSKSKTETFIPSIYFPVVLALAGNKNFSMKGIPKIGVVKAIKKLEKLMADGKINYYGYNIDEIINHLNMDEYSDIIKKNYTIFKLDYFYELLNDMDIGILQEGIIDKDDLESVITINDKYYKSNPIDLDFLFDGYYY